MAPDHLYIPHAVFFVKGLMCEVVSKDTGSLITMPVGRPIESTSVAGEARSFPIGELSVTQSRLCLGRRKWLFYGHHCFFEYSMIALNPSKFWIYAQNGPKLCNFTIV